MKKMRKLFMWILITIGIVFVALLSLGIVLMYLEEKEAEKVPVNREDYILYSFDLTASSGNAFAPEENKSYSFYFYNEKLSVNVPEMRESKKIELNETERKNLETDLLNLIENHGLAEWNGYDEFLPVTDASNGFSLRIKYKNEEEIIANGSFMFPDNYGEVFDDIEETFAKYHNFYKLEEE